jgi:hypothetical protein
MGKDTSISSTASTTIAANSAPVDLVTPQMATHFRAAAEALKDGYQPRDRGELERASKSAVQLSVSIVAAKKNGQEVQGLLGSDPEASSAKSDLEAISRALAGRSFGSMNITPTLTQSTVSAALDNMNR